MELPKTVNQLFNKGSYKLFLIALFNFREQRYKVWIYSTDDFKKSSVEFFIVYYNRWNLYLNGKTATLKKFEKFLI